MRRLSSIVVGVVLVTSCGDGTGVSLTPADVAGAYVATVLTIDDGTNVVDQLALGASIQITLTANGETTGLLFVPGGATDGSDFTADLAGTWTLNGQAVRLIHVSNSFLRDVIFAYADGTLSGVHAAEATTIQVVLSR